MRGSGISLEVLPHNQYWVRMDGSCQISLRNRQYLQKICLFGNKRMGVIRDARVGKGLISSPIKSHKTPECVVQKEVGNQQQQETRRIESKMEIPL